MMHRNPPASIRPISLMLSVEFEKFKSQFSRCVYGRINCLHAKKIDYIHVSGSGGEIIRHIIFDFTQNDIMNGKLVRSHNLNSRVVDISVIDNEGVEIMVRHKIIDNNTVESDFSDIIINGTWKILYEV